MINKTPIIENDLDAITFIAKMVSERSGIQLSERHADMIRSRLLQRQNQLGIPLVQDYLRYLMEHFDSEIKKCISLLTTHHTFFFREFIQFEFLRDRLLQEVIPNVRRRQDKTLRIWSAACSYGQEVYSIATFLKHHLSEFPDINFEVIGSDIDEDAISFAKNGVFQKVSVKDIPRNYLTTGFSQGQGRVESFVKVKKAVHEHCKFHVLNLFDIEPWFLQQKFDIIFCRNVLIYFNHLQTQKIISTLSSMLDPLGFLFLGVSESMDMTNQQFQIAGPSIYTRKQAQKNIPQIDTKLTSQPDISPKTIRVLIVDDSPSVVAIMKKIFTSEQDFEVCGSVSNGVEAREYLNQHSCDVITLDIHMPVQDGKAFLATNYQKSKDPPVVLVTGVSEEQTSIVKECLALGAADYVEKPSVEEFKKASIEIQNKVRAAVMTKAKMNSRNDLAPRNQSQQSYLKNIQVYQSEVHKVFKFFLKKDEVFVGLLTDITQTSHSLGIKFISSRDDDSQWAEFIKLIQEKKQIFSSIKIVLDQDISLGQEIYHKLKSYCKEIKTIPSPPGSEIHFSPFERKILLKKTAKPQADAHQSNINPPVEKKIRVFIVDDSQSIRLLLRRLLESDSRFEVIGESGHPNEAFHEILKCSPDILTLDIHMPELNGIELLKRIFEKTFIPTVMISSIRPEEGNIVLESLEAGAIDYIEKPEMSTITLHKSEILNKLYYASQVKKPVRALSVIPHTKTKFSQYAIENTLIVIGSSTGGTEALAVVLKSLPNDIPPILIVQHIPKDFSKSLADRLNQQLSFQVLEAKDGDKILPNRVLIAPGGYQMALANNKAAELCIRVEDLPPRNHHKPSVDYLFDSVVQCWKKNLVGVILTGMGRDGADGLLKMRHQGARTIGQDQASCVVYGMPRAAKEIGALDIVADLGSIGREIVKQANDVMHRKKMA